MVEKVEDTNRKQHCIAFGRKVRSLREAKELSQEDFAHLVGIHRTYIGGIERGERNPTLTNIHRIADALGVAPSKLLD
jgi:transcriptional regulator with XRE-family HTH domain